MYCIICNNNCLPETYENQIRLGYLAVFVYPAVTANKWGCGGGVQGDNDLRAIARNKHCCVQKHSLVKERILSGSNESKVKKRPPKIGQRSALEQPCRGQLGTCRYHLPKTPQYTPIPSLILQKR